MAGSKTCELPPWCSGTLLNHSTLPVGSTTEWIASDGTPVTRSPHSPTCAGPAAASARRPAPADGGGAPAEAGHDSQLAAR